VNRPLSIAQLILKAGAFLVIGLLVLYVGLCGAMSPRSISRTRRKATTSPDTGSSGAQWLPEVWRRWRCASLRSFTNAKTADATGSIVSEAADPVSQGPAHRSGVAGPSFVKTDERG